MLPLLRNPIYLVTNRATVKDEKEFIWRIMEAVRAGVSYVQIRDVGVSPDVTLTSVMNLKKLILPFGAKLIVNNSLNIAFTAQVGLHIGMKDVPFSEARKRLGPEQEIGLSVNNMEELKEAQKTDAQYLGITVFQSLHTKKDCSPLGLDGLKEACKYEKQIAVIGGIRPELLPEIVKIIRKNDRIAMVGDLWRGNTYEVAKKCIEIIQKFSQV